MFQNREDAGRQLAGKLERYRGKEAIVLGLPRGGVVIGEAIAGRLGLPLDVIVTRKVGHPRDPEYAICATDEAGTVLSNEAETKFVNQDWFKGEIERQRKEAARRLKMYRNEKEPPEIKGKIVIIADDGVATGLTMRLAVKMVKKQRPALLIVAVPVASPEAVRELEREIDEIIMLEPPKNFRGAIGAHYQEFEPVEDEDVRRLLLKRSGF